MKFGVLSSSGGGALRAFLDCLDSCEMPFDLVVATDRSCGIEELCQERGIHQTRLSSLDRERLSAEAASFFVQEGATDAIFLFYTRLVGPELYETLPVCNLHESLLPQFPGLGAIPAFLESKEVQFGCTLHRVDGTTDGGEILSQIALPRQELDTLETLHRIAFWQKVFLLLLSYQTFLSSRSFSGKLISSVEEMRGELGCEKLFSALKKLDHDQRIGALSRISGAAS